MSKRIFKFLALVLPTLLFFSCSCGGLQKTMMAENRDIVAPALSAFLKIDVDLIKRECSEESKTCEISRTDFLSGSGFVVKKAIAGGSYIMTAGHVCRPDDIMKRFARDTETVTHGLVFTGLTKEKESFSMKVLEVNLGNDLCLLYSEDLERVPIEIADDRLLPGAKILNIASPKGILFRNAPIIIDGIYNGQNADTLHDMYTMLVAGGSSGSVIMNEDGEAVGVVSMMDLRFPYIVYSPSHPVLREFVERATLFHSLRLLGSIDPLELCVSGKWSSCNEILRRIPFRQFQHDESLFQ